MKRFLYMVVGLIILIATSSLMATSILIQKPEVVFKQAPLIVEVTVKDIKFRPISNLSAGEALITLSVVDRIVGHCPSEILIHRENFTSSLEFLETEWYPTYSIGEHFIICLFPTSLGYSTMGLYNGKYNIEQDYIKGTTINFNQFKQQILDIRSGQRTEFPNELPRQISSEIKNKLEKSGKISKVTAAGSFLNGEFITWNFTWDTDYLPVTMYYNPSNAPRSAQLLQL